MGDHLEFKGEDGKVKSAYVNVTRGVKSRKDLTKVLKYDISFENPEDLKVLLNMDENDVVTMDGVHIPYREFKKDIIDNARRIYTSKDGKFLDQVEEVTRGKPSTLDKSLDELARKSVSEM